MILIICYDGDDQDDEDGDDYDQDDDDGNYMTWIER